MLLSADWSSQLFDLEQIRAMYPDATPDALREAIAFERSLISPTAA